MEVLREVGWGAEVGFAMVRMVRSSRSVRVVVGGLEAKGSWG